MLEMQASLKASLGGLG